MKLTGKMKNTIVNLIKRNQVIQTVYKVIVAVQFTVLGVTALVLVLQGIKLIFNF